MLRPVPEAANLERRVLAHERVLHALIAYPSRAEPRFVDHLRERFGEPMSMARREHNHHDSDDSTEEFIRAVMLLGEVQRPKMAGSGDVAKPIRQPDEKQTTRYPFRFAAVFDRVKTRNRNGIWEVKIDGVFIGDYHDKSRALAAATRARSSLR